MGVIRSGSTPTPIGEWEMNADHMLALQLQEECFLEGIATDEVAHPSPPTTPPPATVSEPPKPRRKVRQRALSYPRPANTGKQDRCPRGSRKLRRFENDKFLMNMSTGDEIDEIGIEDFIPSTVSAFAVVLKEKKNWDTWNSFVHSSEEEQERILSMASPRRSNKSNDKDKMDDSFVVVDSVIDSESAFSKIDAHLKAILKRRHLPLGALAQLEEEVTEFFQDWPSAVYISSLLSSFQRLLLHSICQYHRLKSKSFDDEKGRRRTRVENTEPYFVTPPLSLTSYIETNFHAR